MAATRKLQANVDRTLKRITEGIAWFAGAWSKYEALAPSVRLSTALPAAA